MLEEIKELPSKYPQPRSAVMPALDLAQEELGYLTPEAMSEVAAALELDPGYVEGVATFYSLFHLEPTGRHRLYICTNLSCMIRGAYGIVDQVKKSIGVGKADEVSADGLFSYEEVECLGACEYAPMMRLDHRYHYDLTPEKIEALIAERRNGKKEKKEVLPIHGKEVLPARGEVAPKAPEGLKEVLPARGEVAPKAPEGLKAPVGPKAKKPRAPRKKKTDV